MNKTQFITAVSEKSELKKKDAEAAVNAAIDVIIEELKKGESVQLTGFGVFKVKETKARKGHNLATGEIIEIEAGKRPAFAAGKLFKDGIK